MPNYTLDIKIDKNASTFCQNHSDKTPASCLNGSTPHYSASALAFKVYVTYGKKMSYNIWETITNSLSLSSSKASL